MTQFLDSMEACWAAMMPEQVSVEEKETGDWSIYEMRPPEEHTLVEVDKDPDLVVAVRLEKGTEEA